MAYEQQTAERVRKVLSRRRGVVEKTLMGGLCFMVDGGMCCSVSGRGGLLVRVGPQAHEHMLREAHVQPMEMGGRTMKGFVRVAPEGYRTDASLRTWIERGLAFLAAQSAKSSGKRRKAPARRTKRGTK